MLHIPVLALHRKSDAFPRSRRTLHVSVIRAKGLQVRHNSVKKGAVSRVKGIEREVGGRVLLGVVRV